MTTLRNLSMLLVSLCILGLASSSADAAFSFTEDSSNAGSLPGLHLRFSTGGDNIFLNGVNATFLGGSGGTPASDRIYLKTVDSDCNTVDFVAKITFATNFDSFAVTAFFGMGPGEPDGTVSNEPQIGEPIFIRAFSETDFTANNGTDIFNPGTGLYEDAVDNTAGVGTHRLRITWDATAKEMTGAIDWGNDGSFEHTMGPINDNGLTSLDSHIFFGTDNGVFFDDFTVTDSSPSGVPEPTTAGLAFLALAGHRCAGGGGVKPTADERVVGLGRVETSSQLFNTSTTSGKVAFPRTS